MSVKVHTVENVIVFERKDAKKIDYSNDTVSF